MEVARETATTAATKREQTVRQTEEKVMKQKRTGSQLEQSPLEDMVTEGPTIDELLADATDEQLDRLAAGEDPEVVLRGKKKRP